MQQAFLELFSYHTVEQFQILLRTTCKKICQVLNIRHTNLRSRENLSNAGEFYLWVPNVKRFFDDATFIINLAQNTNQWATFVWPAFSSDVVKAKALNDT